MSNRASDWFLDVFTAEAERIIEKLKESTASRLHKTPTYWWVNGVPNPPKTYEVAAVDGGAAIQPLLNGGAIYVVRAYGHHPSLEPERMLEMKILPVRDSRILDALRIIIEHQTASRLALRVKSNTLLLMDGSLWTIIVNCLKRVYRLALNRVESLGSLYLSLYSLEALVALSDFLSVTSRRGINVVYVSKDHSFRVVKEKVLLELVAESAKELREIILSSLQYYPIPDRMKLLRLRKAVPPHLQQVYDAAIDLSYRDTAFIQDAVGLSIGYTWPLTIPPPIQLHANIISRGGVRWLIEAACENALELLDGEDVGVCYDASRLVKALESLPRIKGVYVRFAMDDNPLLIEVPENPGDFYATGRVFLEPDERLEFILSVLAGEYEGPLYYNVPLIIAHMNATIQSSQLNNYMKLLEALAAARGVILPLARRTRIHSALKRRWRRR